MTSQRLVKISVIFIAKAMQLNTVKWRRDSEPKKKSNHKSPCYPTERQKLKPLLQFQFIELQAEIL